MRATSCRLVLGFLAIFFVLSLPAHAQQVTKGLDIGFPEGGVFSGSDFDNVQLNNGNLHIEIPLLTIPGRGMPVVYKYVYDNRGWFFHGTCGHLGTCTDTVWGEQGNNMGLPISSPFDWQLYVPTSRSTYCAPGINYLALTNVVLREPDGTKHHFLPDPANPPGTNSCNAWGSSATMYADDGSGWIVQNNPTTGTHTVIRKDGTFLSGPEDSNGNQLSYNSTTLTYTDTLGRSVPGPTRMYDTVGILSSHPSSFTYYDSSGTPRTIQITYTSVTVQTSQCIFSGADTCNEYSGTWSMPYQITLPNNQTYTFTYAQGAYGEPTSVTLPTGAQISWTWNGDGFAPGGRIVASRTVTVGGQSYTWTYSGAGTAPYPVIVHDPLGNEVRHTFGTGTGDGSPLETKVESFQGTVGGQLIKTVQTDYTFFGGGGGSFSTAAPIRETTTWNQTNQVTKVENDWDSITVTNGTSTLLATWKNPIERREFAFGIGAPGALVR